MSPRPGFTLEAARVRLRELRAERERVARAHAAARVTLPTLDELRPQLRAKLREIGDTLRGEVASGRLTLGALLQGRRIRVYRDGRIESAVAFMVEPPPALTRSRTPQDLGDPVVAGGGFEPPTSGL
jgi:hypothetical protein